MSSAQALQVQLYEFLPERPAEIPTELVGVLDWWGQDPDQPGAMPPLELWSHPARAGRELSGFRTVEFPIQASPKSFTAYLQDMKTLCIRLYGITTSGGMLGDPVGLSEIDLQPWLRGPDVDYALRVEGFFPVVRSHSDRVMVGQLRICLRTDWAEDAELRPKAEAIRSFEQHELQARLTEERSRAARRDVRHDAERAGPVLVPSPVVGAHLQVHLCGLRLQRSALDSGSAGDLRVAFRFGPADEVSVAASLQEEDSDSVIYLLGSAEVSSTPVWQLRDGRVDAPRLSSMHFHFWQGKQLFGLAGLPLPATGLPTSEGRNGLNPIFLLCQDVEVRSVSSGHEIGRMKLALHAGPADALKAQPPYSPMQKAPKPVARPPQASQGPVEEAMGATEDPAPARTWASSLDQVLPGTARDETSSCLWLVASGISADEVLAEARRPHQKPGRARSPLSTLELDELCEALMRAVEGLAPKHAVLLASKAKCGQRMVSTDLWKGVVLEVSARLEAALDLLQQEVGCDALGKLAEQLAALGVEASLRHGELAAALTQHASRGPRWGLMDELLRLLDPSSAGVLPARPLAKLVARRAETLRKAEEPRSAEETMEADRNEPFRAPSLPAARQLLSAFFCLLRAGEVRLQEAANLLDAAAKEVSRKQPSLWCSKGSEEAVLAGILETDKAGILEVVKAWQTLRLPTSASPAAAALRSLAQLENSELRVREAKIQEAMALSDSSPDPMLGP